MKLHNMKKINSKMAIRLLERTPKFRYIEIFSSVSLAIIIRLLLEYIFFEQHFSFNYFYSIVLIERFSFLFFTFLLSTVIVYLLSKENIRKILSFLSKIYWVIIIPPLIDHLIFGRTTSYTYALPNDFLKNFFTFFTQYQGLFSQFEGAGIGIIIECFLICFLFAYYIFYKTKSIIRAVSAIFIIYLSFSLLGTLWISVFVPEVLNPPSYINTPDAFVKFYVNTYKRVLAIFFLISSFIILSLIAYKLNKNAVISLIKNIRPMRTLYFLFMVIGGAFIGCHTHIQMMKLFSGIVSAFFVWQFTIIVNDISDEKIDKKLKKKRPLVIGSITKFDYMSIAVFLGMYSILFAILIDLTSFLIVLLCVLLAILYSIPPFRLRNTLLGTFFIGIGSSLLFFLGYFSQGGILNFEIIFIGVTIFLVGSLATTVKDITDYEGDKRYGVKNIFTIFGKKRGKQLSLTLMGVSFLLPLLLVNSFFDIIFFVGAAITSVADFKKYENVQRIIFYSLVMLGYFFFRVKMIL